MSTYTSIFSNVSTDAFPVKEIKKAIVDGDVENVKMLLDEFKGDINMSVDIWFKKTFLHIAAYKGNVEIIKILIERGANINSNKHMFYYYPLHIAAAYNNVDAIIFLVNSGTDINAVTNDGRTALHMAAFKQNLDAVKALIKLGANMNIFDDKGYTPIYDACCNGCIPIIEEFIVNGVDVNSVAPDKCTTLHTAVTFNQVEVVKVLLKHGANPRLKCKYGSEPSRHASAEIKALLV